MSDAPPPAERSRSSRRMSSWPKPGLKDRISHMRLRGSDWALTLPVAAAAAWFAGFEGIAMTLALGLPAVLMLTGRGLRYGHADLGPDRVLSRRSAQTIADNVLAECAQTARHTAALLLCVDRGAIAGTDWHSGDEERAMDGILRRVAGTLRDSDAVFRMGDDIIAVILQPTRRADLDVVLSVAERMQAAVAEPLSIGGRTLRVDSRVGICTDAMSPSGTGAALLSGAACALRSAARHEAGAVRCFTAELQQEVETGHRLTLQVEDALAQGDIRPWFQPQVDARTGALVGFEALARWYHADLGVLTPNEFLPSIDGAGQGAALGERMLRDALAALDTWDRAGLDVQQVGVNLSLGELRDPRLADRIIWEIDRCDAEPGRIAIEILETVTLDDAEEVIIRNVQALRAAGLRIDLDDFGTGAAAISHIARFGVHRIKIDRSFVGGLEASDEKRRIIAAILRLAAELKIETLAEGVETEDQIRALAEMGCTHLQGYAIARPMPLDDTIAWARKRVPDGPDLARVVPMGRA